MFLLNLIVIQPLKSQGLPLNLNPCIGIHGPVFPTDSATLCEVFDDFDPDYTIPHNTYASALTYPLFPEGATYYNGRDIQIEGNFLIDVPVAFKNCRIKMNPGAQIVVSARVNPSELFVRKSQFFSCDTMWKGITLGRGTKCRLYWTRIEDAQYALVVDTSVALTIFKGTFNRNFVSITNRTRNSALPFLTLTHNTFTCTSPLNEPYDLPAFTNYDPVSFAGILLNECSSSIGYFNANNVFDNLIYGILAANASVANVKGCTFLNAQETAAIPDLVETYPIQSSGIAAVGSSSLFLIGNNLYHSSSFNRADIQTNASNLQVANGDFVDSKSVYGGFIGETAILNDNNFEAINEGSSIIVERSMATGFDYHTEVFNNNFFSDAELNSSHHGIFINGIHAPTDYAIVHNNNIDFHSTYSAKGILSQPANSHNLIIEDNTIRIEGVGEINCIGIQSRLTNVLAEGHILRDNIITGTNYGPSDPTIGIDALSAGGILYCNNTIDSIGIGIQFRGMCDESRIVQNNFNKHGTGLFVRQFREVPAIIGPQKRTRNEWFYDAYQDVAARLQNTNIVFNDYSPYFLTPSDISIEAYNPIEVTPSGWFREEDGDHDLCLFEPRPLLTSFDSLILNSHSLFESFADPTKFYLEKNLISKLLNNDELRTEWSSYLSSMDQTSEYLIAQVEVGLKEAFKMDSIDQADLDSLLEAMKIKLIQLQPFDSINYANIDTVTFTEGVGLDSTYAKLKACCELAKSQTIIKAIRRATLYTDLGDLQVALDTISTRANYDEYYKTIYTLFIKKQVDGTLTPSEDSIILDIAMDDTDSSLANILAFDLFRPCSSDTFPSYHQTDVEQHSLNQGFEVALDKSKKQEVIVQSNAEGLRVYSRNNVNGMFQVFDLSGRIVYSNYFNEQYGDFAVSIDVAPGIYYWRLMELSQRHSFSSGIIPIIK